MTRRLASFILCGGMAVLGVACATKDFVQERVSASESKLADQMTATQTQFTERADLQETKLRETAERTGENRRAVDAADQRLRGLDTQVSEVGTLAEGAKTRADSAAVSAQGGEARLAQRFAGRNKYRLLDTKSVYFGSGQSSSGARTSPSSTRWPGRSRPIPTRSSTCKVLGARSVKQPAASVDGCAELSSGKPPISRTFDSSTRKLYAAPPCCDFTLIRCWRRHDQTIDRPAGALRLGCLRAHSGCFEAARTLGSCCKRRRNAHRTL